MKLVIVAVGQRVPDWAQTAWDDYAKRFPHELKVELKAIKTEPRGSKTVEQLYAAERKRIEEAWKQPRLFEEPKPKTEQLDLMEGMS